MMVLPIWDITACGCASNLNATERSIQIKKMKTLHWAIKRAIYSQSYNNRDQLAPECTKRAVVGELS